MELHLHYMDRSTLLFQFDILFYRTCWLNKESFHVFVQPACSVKENIKLE